LFLPNISSCDIVLPVVRTTTTTGRPNGRNRFLSRSEIDAPDARKGDAVPRVVRTQAVKVRKNSAITRNVREASDRLYEGFLRGRRDEAFAEFVRQTEKDFHFMAGKLFRRWALPESEEPRDVVQTLLAEIARILPKFDPKRARIADFLVWNAFARGKKYTNRQRGAQGDRLPSRHALASSSFASERPETQAEILDRLARRSDLASELDAEAMNEGRDVFARVCRYMTQRERELFARLVDAQGDAEEAAARLLDREPAVARSMRATNVRAARTLFAKVSRDATAIAHALGILTVPAGALTTAMRDAIEEMGERVHRMGLEEAIEDGIEEKQGGGRGEGRGRDEQASGRGAARGSDRRGDGARGPAGGRLAGREGEPARSALRARVA
jgi:hypothetical protein